MAKQKAWDEIRKLRLSGIAPKSINIFLRTEIPKARKLVDELQRNHASINITVYRNQMMEEIKKQFHK